MPFSYQLSINNSIFLQKILKYVATFGIFIEYTKCPRSSVDRAFAF